MIRLNIICNGRIEMNNVELKLKLYLIGYIIFGILTLIGCGYVHYNGGAVSPGYTMVPMVFAISFGAGYRRTKKAIDNNKPFQSLDSISYEVMEEIKEAKQSGDVVKAVKTVKETTNVSLKDAKQFVDKL